MQENSSKPVILKSGYFVPKGYLIMSADIFWLSQLGSAIGILLVEVKDPGKHPKVHRTEQFPTTKICLTQNVNSTGLKNPALKQSYDFHNSSKFSSQVLENIDFTILGIIFLCF